MEANKISELCLRRMRGGEMMDGSSGGDKRDILGASGLKMRAGEHARRRGDGSSGG